MSAARDFPPVEAYQDTRTNRPAPEPFSVAELAEIKTASSADIAQGLFGRGDVVALVGAPNAGKTACAIDLCLALAAGETWFGSKVARGPVVYFAAEAPGSVIMRARAAAERKFAGRRLPFYIATGTPGLGAEASTISDTERVIQTVRAVESNEGEAVLVVTIDTLASCLAGGDENGDGMLRLVAAAKHIALTLGCAVVLVHHPSKADATGLRGHGSLAAACDAILSIAIDEISGVRTATLVKSRDSATGRQFAYRLEPVELPERDAFGDPRTTIVVVPAEVAHVRPRPSGKQQQSLLAELERRHRTGETAWDEATIRGAGKDLGMVRSARFDALRGLQRAGYLIGSPAHLTLKFPPEAET